VSIRDVTEPAKICIHSCAKSVGCGCRFVERSKLVLAIITTAHMSVLLTVNIVSYNPARSSSDNIPS